MIQDILPHKYDNSFKQPALAKDSFLLYIHRGTILLRGRDEQGEENQEQGKKQDYREKIYASAHTLPAPDALELPAAAQLEETGLIPGLSARAEYLFSIDEIPYFMVRSAEGDPALKLAEEENQETFQEDGSGSFPSRGRLIFGLCSQNTRPLRPSRSPAVPVEGKPEILRLLRKQDRGQQDRAGVSMHKMRPHRVSENLPSCDCGGDGWRQAFNVPVQGKGLPRIRPDCRLCGDWRDL